MKLTKNLLRQIGIYNSYDYALGRFYIDYLPSQTGRMAEYSKWIGIQAGKKFSEHWRDYGNKSITVTSRKEKQDKFLEMCTWAESYLGVTGEFVKTPMGSYMLKEFVVLRNKQLVKKIKNELGLIR